MTVSPTAMMHRLVELSGLCGADDPVVRKEQATVAALLAQVGRLPRPLLLPDDTPGKVRVVAISDTHTHHRFITLPDGDVLGAAAHHSTTASPLAPCLAPTPASPVWPLCIERER